MSNNDEARRRAEEAKRKLAASQNPQNQQAGNLPPPNTPRPGSLPVDQTAERQAAERQLQQQEEGERQEAEAQAIAVLNAQNDAADLGDDDETAKPKKKGKQPGTIEVLLKRKYAPINTTNDAGETVPQGEIKDTLPAGSTVSLPEKEAFRAMKLGIAEPTAATFEED